MLRAQVVNFIPLRQGNGIFPPCLRQTGVSLVTPELGFWIRMIPGFHYMGELSVAKEVKNEPQFA